MFDQLQGCRVVEGFVQILLFDTLDSSDFANLSFPELTEITDYLLLFRVSGLLSLGQLFPNLVVIRGYQLLFGYSFVVFEMPSLQEINLYSLTDIVRGSIRIDKNPSLCFVETIDWTLIAHMKTGHFIKSIKAENECPVCPGEDGSENNRKRCQIAEYSNNDDTKNRYLCWNNERCQKVCKKNCRACDEKGNCCDEKCLGGCSVHDPSKCTVCKNFAMGEKENKTCLTNCPSSLYEYLGRKCVTRDECISFKDNRVQEEYPYRIFNNSCIMECPKDYMDDTVNRTCIPCEGKCKKVCAGRSIDNLASIQEFSGCTHINGSLEIQVRGGGQNIVHYLEENLKLISEIDGYLKIVRSFPLISLSFFKNLRIIHGNILESGRYAISVLDNQNLQDVWDWQNRTLTIGNGTLFFHFNPKLCPEKIEVLRKEANLPESEVSASSNGDKVACNVTNFTVSITNINSHEVELQWKKFEIIDSRKLLAFLIYYIEAPWQNISLYDNRDACGDDGWSIVDVPIPETYMNITHMIRILAGLKPYTQYAFYIKTYTIATEKRGGESHIQYFRTDADQPAPIPGCTVSSNSSDSLKIKWEPTKEPNGNITYYKVTLIRNEKLRLITLHQDYCDRHPHPTVKPFFFDQSIITSPKSNDTCECKGKPKSIVSDGQETERSSQISFEDELINKVYVKRPEKEIRRKRETVLEEEDIQKLTSNNTASGNSSIFDKQRNYNISVFIVNNSLELFVNKLQHYTDYTVSIQACREKIPGNTRPECSEPFNKTGKTSKKDDADIITSGISIYHENQTAITLTWQPPSSPNGNILYYLIEYKRLDIENPYTQCITHTEFEQNHHLYTLYGLNSGNYSVRVLPVSEAKTDRKFSNPVYFVIEESTNYDIIIIFGTLVSLGVTVMILFVTWKKYFQKPSDNKLIATVNPEYISTAYEPDDWEVPRKKIELHKELGQGSFGMVYEGIARDIKGRAQVRCAIKTVNEHATNRERIEFLNEASVMKAFDTAHVVKLLGVVSQGQPTLVIMELMANGDLKTYLRSHRPDTENYSGSRIRQPPTLKRILQMAIEIADGMAYLAAKKFVHRDLAARNCMVSEDLTVKIGDFGMTRDIYETDYYRKGTKGLLPVRWMAPESLKDGIFSSSSDIWSYGVVLWEMATLASQPYQGLSNDQVLRYVIDGGIMERPENCPDKLYMLMMYCWKHKYTERPTFLELCSLLLEDSSSQFSKVSFYHSAAGMEARSSRSNQFDTQDDPTTPLRLMNDVDENFSLNGSGADSEVEESFTGGNNHLEFSNYPVQKDSSAAANGYLSANASNGTTA
ncbi:InR [Trypoxylus dichotomus]